MGRCVGNLTTSQYLARLAAEATTVIDAPDYARIVSDLAARRHLIAIAEDCVVAAQTANIDTPVNQIVAAFAERIGDVVTGPTSGNGGNARTMTAAEFLKLELPPRQKIIDPWLPEKGLVMAYSPRGVGKTLLGMTSAYAMASGSDFLGFKTARPRKVLYIDGEMPAESMQERLAAIVAGITKQPAADDYLE